MTETPVTTPIVIPESAIVKQIITAVQYVITAAGAWALGKGYVEQDTIEMLLSLAAMIVPAGVGIYKTWKNNEQKKVMNKFTPETVSHIA